MPKTIYSNNIIDVFQTIENLSDLINYIYNENKIKKEEDDENKTNNMEKENNIEILVPNINIVKNDDVLNINVELPGVSREDIELSVINENNNNILKIETTRIMENIKEDEKVIKNEIKDGILKREIYLPDNINIENIIAEYENGILNIKIPVINKVQEKKIKIL